MKFWVGVTDNSWYEFLARGEFDEVNFWQPSAMPLFSGAPVGMPFLFKLKRPFNHIAGGGLFVANSVLPLSLAWEIFGRKNGADSFEDLQQLIDPHIENSRRRDKDPLIGCTVLSNPFFIDQYIWMADPPDWSPNIVRGKHYETSTPAGELIWSRVESYLRAGQSPSRVEDLGIVDSSKLDRDKFGSPILVKPRLGQSSFRVLVTDAYKRRCAMTGENTLDTLEAAHIIPFSNSNGSHEITNGMLLRSDFHRLFDRGLVSVTPDYIIKISPRIRESYFNGKAYYRLDNQPLQVLPDEESTRPDRDRLKWHFENCFQG